MSINMDSFYLANRQSQSQNIFQDIHTDQMNVIHSTNGYHSQFYAYNQGQSACKEKQLINLVLEFQKLKIELVQQYCIINGYKLLSQ